MGWCDVDSDSLMTQGTGGPWTLTGVIGRVLSISCQHDDIIFIHITSLTAGVHVCECTKN